MSLWLQQAYARFQAGDAAQAAALAERALRDNPHHADALQLLGLSLCAQGRHPQALPVLEYAAACAPADAQIHYNLGVTCQELGLFAQAVEAYRACLRIKPAHNDALWNLGDLLRLDEQFDAAIECFGKLLAANAQYPGLKHRMAVALHGAGRDEEAGDCFRAELDGQPLNAALTHWEYSHLLLRQGIFEAGWRSYDQRFVAGISVACHPYPQPRWAGQSLKGKTLLVHGEQGLGDELMFASIIPELIKEGARIVLACQPPLVALFQQSFPQADVRAHTVYAQPADVSDVAVDYQIPIGSLARYRRKRREQFSNGGAYLQAVPGRMAEFKTLLAAHAQGNALKIGIMWGANPAHGVIWGQRRSQQKSIPVELLESLSTARNDVCFVSLQNRERGHEVALAPALKLLDCQRELNSMADTAALIANLDLVISVDTSVAHLAGGMGKPVWIPLMQRADWRWLRDGETSYWYSSARLFRQTTQGDWPPVIAAMQQALQEWQP